MAEGLSVSLSWRQYLGLKTESMEQMFAVVELGEVTTTAK